jgi:hypothetical protein
MLLILSAEYNTHQSALSVITSDHDTITINSNDWIYCNVTNQVQFDLYSVNLNVDNYSDEILLPLKALNK